MTENLKLLDQMIEECEQMKKQLEEHEPTLRTDKRTDGSSSQSPRPDGSGIERF